MRFSKIRSIAIALASVSVLGTSCTSTETKSEFYTAEELGYTTFVCGDTTVSIDADGLRELKINGKETKPLIVNDSKGDIQSESSKTSKDDIIFPIQDPLLPQGSELIGRIETNLTVYKKSDSSLASIGDLRLRGALVNKGSLDGLDKSKIQSRIDKDILFGGDNVEVRQFVGSTVVPPEIAVTKYSTEQESQDTTELRRDVGYPVLKETKGNGFISYSTKVPVVGSGQVGDTYIRKNETSCEASVWVPNPFPKGRDLGN